MGPIDYSINVDSPFRAAVQGYQVGSAIREDQLKAEQMQAAQAQAQAQAMQLAQAREAAFQNPTAANFARLMTLDPKASEAYQRAWTARNTEQQQSLASDLLQWGAAIKSGKPQIAADQLNARAAMIEQQNGGAPTQDSQAMRLQARLALEQPEFALGQIQALLASNPLGKDAAETLGKFGTEARAAAQAPSALRKSEADAAAAEAEAKTKGVAAKYAEQNVLKDLEMKGWNVENIKSEIAHRKETARIAAMQAAASREGNDLKRQELQLKVQEARSALDEKARAKVAEVEGATTTIDNFLNTADRIIAAGVGADGKPNSTLRAATGPIDSRIPTVQTDVANIEALVETLGSQAFLSQVSALKGMGQLSDAEGRKIQAALTNLSLSQGADQLLANVKEAQRLVMKARKNVETRYGIKAPAPDTPAVQTPAADIDALVKKYGGG